MSCCGRHRAELRRGTGAPADRRTPEAGILPSLPVSPTGSVPLRYTGGFGATVRGPVTQRSYTFTAARPVQRVDRRDAAGLLRTRLFRRSS